MKFHPDVLPLLEMLEPFGDYDGVLLAHDCGLLAWEGECKRVFLFPDRKRINFWTDNGMGQKTPLATFEEAEIRVRSGNIMPSFVTLREALDAARSES